MYIRLVSIKIVAISLLLTECCINAADSVAKGKIRAFDRIEQRLNAMTLYSMEESTRLSRDRHIVTEFNNVVVPYLIKIHGNIEQVKVIIQRLLSGNELLLLSVKENIDVIDTIRSMRNILKNQDRAFTFVGGEARIILFSKVA